MVLKWKESNPKTKTARADFLSDSAMSNEAGKAPSMRNFHNFALHPDQYSLECPLSPVYVTRWLGWKTANCSAAKCFFNSASDSSLGYLVLDSTAYEGNPLNMTAYDVMFKVWEFASTIHTKYGAKHFFLGPPQQVQVSDQIAMQLDVLVNVPSLPA